MVVTYRARKLTHEDEEQLKKDIDETIHYLRTGKIEKGLEKAEQMFSREDGFQIASLHLEDFVGNLLYGEYLPNQTSNEEYLQFLKTAINRKIFEHNWMETRWKDETPNPVVDILFGLISEEEYDLAQQLMSFFPSQYIRGDQIAEMLGDIKHHNELISELKRRIPDFTNLEKCLKDQKKFNEVFRTVMENFKETSKESAVNRGKEEVEKRIQKYRDNSERYISKLDQKYSKTYKILCSGEAIFSHPIFRMPIWKDIEATPRAVNYFKAIETFLKERIPSPDKWTLGSFISHNEGIAIKNALNRTWKHRWGKPYNHEIQIKEESKRYSLYDGLDQFLEWRNGKLHTSTTEWDFVDHKLSPFTYELLCDLIDAIT